jgi:phosphatidylserine/phosphatidylglycerophosphate/cardiolipin synthase-like enzyme
MDFFRPGRMLRVTTYILLGILFSTTPLVVGIGEEVSVWFSPKGGTTNQLIKFIKGAKETIDVAVFSFTEQKIVDALVEAAENGVKVRVIVDKSTVTLLMKCLANIELANVEPGKFEVLVLKKKAINLMHNKFAVFDSKRIWTGSFNWTKNGNNHNCENVISFENPAVCKKFEDEFQDNLWPHGKKLSTAKSEPEENETESDSDNVGESSEEAQDLLEALHG